MDNAIKNDYDEISKRLGDIISELVGNAHEPPKNNNSDSITITKDGFLTGIIRAQRLRDWVDGLAETHRGNNV